MDWAEQSYSVGSLGSSMYICFNLGLTHSSRISSSHQLLSNKSLFKRPHISCGSWVRTTFVAGTLVCSAAVASGLMESNCLLSWQVSVCVTIINFAFWKGDYLLILSRNWGIGALQLYSGQQVPWARLAGDPVSWIASLQLVSNESCSPSDASSLQNSSQLPTTVPFPSRWRTLIHSEHRVSPKGKQKLLRIHTFCDASAGHLAMEKASWFMLPSGHLMKPWIDHNCLNGEATNLKVPSMYQR